MYDYNCENFELMEYVQCSHLEQFDNSALYFTQVLNFSLNLFLFWVVAYLIVWRWVLRDWLLPRNVL